MEQIKVGDIVRVSEDIPQFYRKFNSMRVFEVTHKVVDIEDGLALLDSIPVKYATMLPTKYLIKVNAEPKESTIKVGDNVIVKHDAKLSKLFSVFQRVASVVKEINNETATLRIDRMGFQDLELTEVPLEYIEKVDAIEHTPDDVLFVEHKANHEQKPHLVPKIMFDTEYWVKYESDLAKEIAVKITNKKMDNNPEEVGEYAVLVAKSVVENLKKREK